MPSFVKFTFVISVILPLIVDFGNFFETHSHPQYNKYKKVENFKKFKIENGNVVWGKDWDLIFPVSDLYKGKI